jgi:hypothetical protein
LSIGPEVWGVSVKRAKILIAIVVVLVLIGALFGTYILNRTVFSASDILTSSSPAGTYAVTLSGQSERPSFPAVEHTVYFRVVKDGKPFINGKYFHSGDWLDPSFSILYPQHSWLSENILHFYGEESSQRRTAGTALVTNKSDKPIRYLKVVSDDAYLLFDLQPGSTTSIKIPSANSSLLYINVEGEFSDNVKIEEVGVDFIMHQRSTPAEYHIVISGVVPTIDSPQLEKYKPQ